MLNKNNERELAYLVRVDNITPMDADRLECAHVGGWHCVVGKGEFQISDLAVYFEIDSKLPEVKPFTDMAFLASKHYKIKSQKIRGEISQGLLMPITAFGWAPYTKEGQTEQCHQVACLNDNTKLHEVIDINDESRFLTKRLNVTYCVASDNTRKSSSGRNKLAAIGARHPKLFKTRFVRWLARRDWGKRILVAIFYRTVQKSQWPVWVQKTDEERIQNMPFLFTNPTYDAYIMTEKIDGTSATYTLRGRDYRVCSRNVCFTPNKQECFYDENVYTKISERYDMKFHLLWLRDYFDKFTDCAPVDFVTLQGEIYGAGIQKRDYGMKDYDIAIFNVIVGRKDGTVTRANPYVGKDLCDKMHVPFVPVLGCAPLPKTCEETLKLASGWSMIDGGMREGIVFRSVDGVQSFKAVSNEFLLKYHGKD